MKLTPRMKRLLCLLLTLLGAGTGVAVALGGVQLLKITNPIMTLPLGSVMLAYALCISLGALVMFLFSSRIIAMLEQRSGSIAGKLADMTLGQMTSRMLGLICGLIIASLLSQILHFLGDSMFTATMACLLYLVLGAAGLSLGRLREKDVTRLMDRLGGMHGKRFTRRSPHSPLLHPAAAMKLLDTSALIDGRLLDVYKTGFLEGELCVPQFVLDELRGIADASEPAKRARGQRGLEVLQKLRDVGCRVRIADLPGVGEVDARLLTAAKRLQAVLLTGDQNLMKAARLSGIRTLNLNELANVLRPVVHAGDELAVLIAKEGKEAAQGVGYLDDGTMVVVDGGQPHVGQCVQAVVTSALQTNAGRMVFAKLRE